MTTSITNGEISYIFTRLILKTGYTAILYYDKAIKNDGLEISRIQCQKTLSLNSIDKGFNSQQGFIDDIITNLETYIA